MLIPGDGDVLPLDDVAELFIEAVHVEKILHAQRLFHVLVGINRGDAASGRAEFLVGKALLLHDVLKLVIGQADSRAGADLEVSGRDAHTRLAESGALIVKVLKVDDHAVADDIDGRFAQYAGGQEVENELALLIDDGVPGVIAALIAADDVIIRGKQIDHAPLTLVAPVDSHDRS